MKCVKTALKFDEMNSALLRSMAAVPFFHYCPIYGVDTAF